MPSTTPHAPLSRDALTNGAGWQDGRLLSRQRTRQPHTPQALIRVFGGSFVNGRLLPRQRTG